ncbi:MAG: helix-turn-helix transcriptional regulator [Lentisphaerae bacterium]|nr:helix-turn-helix transcriptional regulator [Lentisphaerota bacterium]
MSTTDDTDDLPLFRRLRNARRARGLTQSALAAQAGCTQSALSMMETGRMDALARPTLAKVAELLGVPLDPEPGTAVPAATAAASAGRAFCPGCDCPSNVPLAVNGEIILWPRPQPGGGRRHCAFCGEVLAQTCRGCGAPAGAGACCVQCGMPFVPPPVPEPRDPETWADQRRRQIADWRALLD